MKTILKGAVGALVARPAKAAPMPVSNERRAVSANPYSPVLSVMLLLALALVAKTAPLIHSLMASN